jgi:hypothetical protein
MHLRTGVGDVELSVWQGQDQDGHWGIPIREQWGLKAHQQMSPALEDKLAMTATLTGSYQDAAKIAVKWGYEWADDSVIHALVQRLGSKAEEQTQGRVRAIPVEREPQRAPTKLGVIMIDGWFARFRAEGWGKKRTNKERVEWQELKTGVFYRQEQASEKEGRGIISEKTVVQWQGDPVEFCRRFHWETLRAGLGRAKAAEVLADGAAWIWKAAADRWPQATQMLDFYHGSEHLWQLGHAFCGSEEKQVKPWVESRLHRLRHGQHEEVLKEIATLKVPRGERGRIVQQQKGYFAHQAGRMNYKEIADRDWPIGSGPAESACRQSQCRFKRTGQFWTKRGQRNLSALIQARDNHHWEELWTTA